MKTWFFYYHGIIVGSGRAETVEDARAHALTSLDCGINALLPDRTPFEVRLMIHAAEGRL